MKPILHLKGTMSIDALIMILSEVASFCGEDSQVTCEHFRIKLDIEHFTESKQEQEETIQTMLGALAKYQVDAKVV